METLPRSFEVGPGAAQVRWACPLCRAKGMGYSMARMSEEFLYLAIGMHMAIRHADVAPLERFIPRADSRLLLTPDDAKFLLLCGVSTE